jgi:beta-barrel assembly-enhancing protease
MKIFRYVIAVMAILTILHPVSLIAAESEAQFRQRASSRNEVIASDVAQEVRFGREVAARVLARYGLYEDQKLMKYVNLVGRVLAQTTNRPEIEFRFAVLNTDEINAYAAPGGYVFITHGALLKMQDESELAGVLAHEIGHVVEKHVVKELNIKGSDDSATMGLAAVIGGSSQSARTAFAQAVDKAMDTLFKDGYKRDDEIQADKDAVLFCALSGYEPTGLVKYFERLNAVKGKNTEVLDKTHPSYADRIAWLKSTITQEGIDAGHYQNYEVRFAEAVQ